jgi:hypothetical protein
MGKSQTTTQKVKSDPWGPIAGDLKNAFGDARNIYQQGAPGFFPGQTVANQSGYTTQAFQNMANRATQGNPLMGQASGEVSKMLSGAYLDPNNNPGFQGALSAATRPVVDAFRDNVMPGIDSNFSAAGRYGSGLQGEAYRDANTDLARSVGDISSNMAFNNYGMERGNMMNAIGMAGGLAANDYKDISMLGLAGEGMDNYNQRLIDAERERYDYNANKDMGWLQNYIGMLGGPPPAGQTSTTTAPAPSLLSTIAGLGATAAGAYFGGGGSLGSLFSGLGGAAASPGYMMGQGAYDPRYMSLAFGGPR